MNASTSVNFTIGTNFNGTAFASFEYRQSSYTVIADKDGKTVEVWTKRKGLSTLSIALMSKAHFAIKYAKINHAEILSTIFSQGNHKTDASPSI